MERIVPARFEAARAGGLHAEESRVKDSRLLIYDADPQQRALYGRALAGLKACDWVYETDSVTAERRLAEEGFDALIVAIRPPDNGPLALVEAAHRRDAALPVVIISDPPTVDSATAALRLGAADYLPKPLVQGTLAAPLSRLLEQRRADAERNCCAGKSKRPIVLMTSSALARRCKVFETIEQVADSGVDVLVVGDTGTGKELVARSIHSRSRRARGPFVPVDCGAIPENLLEAEFFGHEKGAFTGAENRSIGLLEFADGGTFFLDELGELPLLMQAKLCGTLQERRIRRVGGRQEIDVDVRVVAATARDLDALIAQGRFRKDLFYRINVVRIDLPPLSRAATTWGCWPNISR